ASFRGRLVDVRQDDCVAGVWWHQAAEVRDHARRYAWRVDLDVAESCQVVEEADVDRPPLEIVEQFPIAGGGIDLAIRGLHDQRRVVLRKVVHVEAAGKFSEADAELLRLLGQANVELARVVLTAHETNDRLPYV